MSKSIVYLMLSGGVDSSISAHLLKKANFKVVGVYFKKYKPDGNKEQCIRDGRSAQKVAEYLNIDFKVWDFEKEYKKYVFDYLIDSYKKGLTPNPDIICNKKIKFGVFAEKAFSEGADLIASGHYAKMANCAFSCDSFCLGAKKHYFGTLSLKEAEDKNKDQSYFLSQVHKEILKKTIFPLYNLKKENTRQIAKEIGLHTADKKDSQGMCFIGKKQKTKGFLEEYIKSNKGAIINIDKKIIGEHSGVEFYTLGERRGFKIFSEFQTANMEPLFIIKKDLENNTLQVGTRKEFDTEMQKNKYILLKDINIFLPSSIGKIYHVRIRHRGVKTKIQIIKQDEEKILLKLLQPVFAPTQGQYAGVYSGDTLIFSGVIAEIKSVL